MIDEERVGEPVNKLIHPSVNIRAYQCRSVRPEVFGGYIRSSKYVLDGANHLSLIIRPRRKNESKPRVMSGFVRVRRLFRISVYDFTKSTCF